MLNLSAQEERLFRKLATPAKVQDFLETLPVNFEERGETCWSPRRVLRENQAHCVEGALFAAAVFWYHGREPLVIDIDADGDINHVVAPFRERGKWGAVSKTNHGVLRYREPVYRSVRELAMSYFHEYFLDNGRKTMRAFSKPLNMKRFARRNWVTAEEDLWYVGLALDKMRYHPVVSSVEAKKLRRADPIEIAMGKLTQWRSRKTKSRKP